MSEGAPVTRKLPSDLEQVPVVWRYELLKYLRSRRLLASFAITFVVVGLIYALPIAFGESYSGTDTRVTVSVVDPYVFGIPPGTLPFNSIGTLTRSGIDTSTLVLYLNGTEYPAGPSTWTLSGPDSRLEIDLGDAALVILFTGNVTGQEVTATYDWRISAQDFDTLFLNFANILIIICATFFGADALVSEFQNRTGYLIFPNPMKRGTLFFGKYAASMTAGIIVVAVFYAGVALLSLYSAHGVDDDYGLSFAYALEYLMAAMAVGYVVSVLMKGTTGATVLTFFLLIMILPIVDSVSMFTGVKMEASLTFASNVLIYILYDPYPVDTTTDFGAGMSFSQFYPDPLWAAVTMLGYAVAAIAISLVVFKRKQLVG
ncbi:MAG: ABC transporter permease [Thermoplasmata archaeon]